MSINGAFDIYTILGQAAIADHYRMLYGLEGDVPTSESITVLTESITDMGLQIGTERELSRLIEKSRSGDKESERILMESCEPLVRAAGERYIGTSNILTDTMQPARAGLQKALEEYDKRKGYPFLGFAAWHVHKAICSAYDIVCERQQQIVVGRQEERLRLKEEKPSDIVLREIVESGECQPVDYETLLSEIDDGEPAFLYLQEIKKVPALTEDEQLVLLEKARSGDGESYHAVLEANLMLAAGIAKGYSSRIQYSGLMFQPLQLDYLDHVQAANHGIINALEEYDLHGHQPLIPTIVWFVHKSICSYYRGVHKEIGHFTKEMNYHLQVMMKYISLGEDHEPSLEELRETEGDAMDGLASYMKKLKSELGF